MTTFTDDNGNTYRSCSRRSKCYYKGSCNNCKLPDRDYSISTYHADDSWVDVLFETISDLLKMIPEIDDHGSSLGRAGSRCSHCKYEGHCYNCRYA